MGVPKKKRSHSRIGMRRAHKALKQPAVVKCSHCNQPRRPHAVCTHCGYYRGRLVVQVTE